MATTPTTPAKTRRSNTTGKRAKNFAPIIDPANTPNITGIAIPGFT
jgi:hypothetical protein